MTTERPKAEEALRRDILEQARRESEQILLRAQHDADALLAKATAEASTERQERLETARAEAARQKTVILATVTFETNRMEAARVEALLQLVREQARQQLRGGPARNRREQIVALAAEAIAQMSGSDFVLKVPQAAPASLAEGLAEDIARRAGRSPVHIAFAETALPGDGGVIIEGAAGRQVWDNRLLVRLERMWPEFRQQIALHAALIEDGGPTGGDG